MGTTAEKGQRVLQSIAEVQEGINNLGGSLTDQTPFKNFRAELDNIYNNLPKTSYAEGSNITLSNTLKGKLDFEDGIVGYGQTEQKSTTGKNKLQFPYIETSKTDRGITYVVNNDGTITVSGTATDNSVITLLNQNSTEFSNIRNLLLNNDCILNGCPSGGSNTSYRLQLYGYTSGGAGALADYGSGVSLSNFANETNTFNVAIFIPTGTVISTPITFKPMIRLASVTDDTYEEYTNGASPNPSYPQEIEVVRGNIEATIRGKNLFNPDITGLFQAWCNATENNGEITITATQKGDIYVGNVLGVGSTYVAEKGKKIYVKPNTRYTIVSTNNNVNKILFTEFDSNNISLGYAQANTLTTKANTSYITVRYGLENAVNGTSYNTKIMVAEGTDTDYEPYQEPTTHKLSLSNIVYSPTEWQQTNTLQPTTGRLFSKPQKFLKAGRYKVITNLDFNTYVYAIEIGSTEYPYQSNLYDSTWKTINNFEFTAPEGYIGILIKNPRSEAYITPSEMENVTFEIRDASVEDYDYEFAKIGNYVDTIEYDVDEDKVYKNVNVGKQILNGDETITLSAISDNTVRIRYSYDLLPYTAKGDLLGLCNRLLAKNIWDIDEEGFFFYGKQLIMRINKETVGTTSTSINAWLENNNMIFNYALEEAVKQEITGTLKDQIKALYYSHSFTGTTIIEIDGQLPLIIKVRALKGE